MLGLSVNCGVLLVMYLDRPVMYPVSIAPDESSGKYFTLGIRGGVGSRQLGGGVQGVELKGAESC